MARNRQRAKARKQKLHRENIPGPLDHASGEVEEVEARIVAGAAGIPADDATALPVDDGVDIDTDPDFVPDAELALDREQMGTGAGDVAAPRTPSGSRLVNFARASWAELQRVQWPDRRQVGQATAVVLGFVVIAGAFLGLADAVAQRIVDFIL
ncbi:MAG: preprotein translocase subunit SecE [Solirubrobacteraceae bacterium]|jgi:preprotein translocase SecE subunit|nr:preprotein translocase subunit SecE [Solirubrobacteraceae bacterium]